MQGFELILNNFSILFLMFQSHLQVVSFPPIFLPSHGLSPDVGEAPIDVKDGFAYIGIGPSISICCDGCEVRCSFLLRVFCKGGDGMGDTFSAKLWDSFLGEKGMGFWSSGCSAQIHLLFALGVS